MRHVYRWILLTATSLLIVTIWSSAWAQTVRERMNSESDFRIFAVIFGVTVPIDSSVPIVRLAMVTDPSPGPTKAVTIEIPDEYIQAATRKIQEKHYKPRIENGKAVEFFTDFLYVPGYPDIVVVDLDKPIDQQM